MTPAATRWRRLRRPPNWPHTVAQRILLTLTQRGGFTVADGKGFRLTPKILNLSMTHLTSLPFWGVAQGVLEQPCAEIKESAALSVFDGHDVVYLMRVPSAKVTSLRLGVTQSMSGKGDCFDNAAIESLFGTLKPEFFQLVKFDNVAQFDAGVHDYVGYYNHERIKLGLQRLSLVEYWLRNTA